MGGTSGLSGLRAVGAGAPYTDGRVAPDVRERRIGRADAPAWPEGIQRRLVELDSRVLLRRRFIGSRREYLLHARPGRVRHRFVDRLTGTATAAVRRQLFGSLRLPLRVA